MLSGFCPNCRSKLMYQATDVQVECQSCDSTIRAADILTSRTTAQARPVGGFAAAGGAVAGGVVSGAVAAMAGIESPESALIYLKNFYDRFDWAHFKLDGDLYPEAVMEMVEDKKMKSGATPIVWLLDFEARITPLNKKLDSLQELEQEMFDVYDGYDYTKVLQVFNDYSFIMNLLRDNQEQIFADLEAAVEYARSFKLEAAKFTQMQTGLAALKKRFEEQVHEIKEIGDEPVIKKAKAASDAKVAKELLERGIEAAGTYQLAVDAFNKDDLSVAAALFAKIVGYSDAALYLSKLNAEFLFHSSIIRIGLKDYFLRKSQEEDYVFDVKHPEEEGQKKKGAGCGKKGKKAEAQPEEQPQEKDPNVYEGEAYTLLGLTEEHLIDKEKVLAAGITKIITTFAGKLLFIQKNKDLAVFDSHDNTVRVIHSASEEGDFGVDVAGKKATANAFYYNKDHTGIFFRKKLELVEEKEEEKKAGCKQTLKNLFKKKKEEPEAPKHKQENNFSILYLDLATFELTELVHEVIDIIEYKTFTANNDDPLRGKIVTYGDVLFYQASRLNPEKPEDEPEKKIYMYSLRHRKELGVVESDHDINAVVGVNVVMTQFTPNAWNKNLFVYNTETGEKTLIEDNVFDFIGATVDHIFYTVGNDSVAPLFSNNYQGTARFEVMKRMLRFVGNQSGWLYAISGSGINTALIKISEDGKQRVTVATQFKRLVKITPSVIFFVDQFGDFCCAKVDGSEQRTILSNVNPANIILGEKEIHLFRYEEVARGAQAFSLYKVDMNGDNLKKIIFNVLSGKNCAGSDLIYLYTEEHQTYEFTDYDEKGQELKSNVPYVLRRYFTYNKVTGEYNTVMRNEPLTAEPIEFKYGCFKRKKKTLTPTYVLIPKVIEIRRGNMAEAGAVLDEKEQAKQDALQEELEQQQNNQNAGCSLGKKPGTPAQQQPAANGLGGCLGGCLNASKKLKKK